MKITAENKKLREKILRVYKAIEKRADRLFEANVAVKI